jgi:hypothetical protein
MLELIIYQEVDVGSIDGPPTAGDVFAVLENQRVSLRAEHQGEEQNGNAGGHGRVPWEVTPAAGDGGVAFARSVPAGSRAAALAGGGAGKEIPNWIAWTS